MDEPTDGRLGPGHDVELRDEAGLNGTPYSGGRPRGMVAVIILALLLIAAAGAYFAFFGTGYPTGASVPWR